MGQLGNKLAFFMRILSILLFLAFNLPVLKAQWKKIPLRTQSSFRSIRNLGDLILIGGTQGTIVKSNDRGKTWKIIQISGAEKLDFRDIVILNKNEILCMSAGLSQNNAAKIFKSNDSGEHWELVFEIKESGYFFDALLWDPKSKNGLIMGDPIDNQFTFIEIKEMGTQYQVKKFKKFPPLLVREAAFAASGSSILALKNRLIMVTGGAKVARVIESQQNNMDDWRVKSEIVQADSSTGFFSIGKKNNKELMVAGGNYLQINTSKTPILNSKDGGETWVSIPLNANFYIEKILWAKPFWIFTGPAKSMAFNPKTNQWANIGESHFHNISLIGDKIFGVGSKGQLAYISLHQIKELFLSKE